MNKKIIVVLIVIRSIPLADGLDALLKAILQIEEVQIIRNFENAIRQIENRKPRIVLIDSALLGNEPEASLEKVALLSPETQRVLLVDDVQEVNLVPRYAEAILFNGISPSAVAAIVTSLLSTKGEENEHNDSNQ